MEPQLPHPRAPPRNVCTGTKIDLPPCLYTSLMICIVYIDQVMLAGANPKNPRRPQLSRPRHGKKKLSRPRHRKKNEKIRCVDHDQNRKKNDNAPRGFGKTGHNQTAPPPPPPSGLLLVFVLSPAVAGSATLYSPCLCSAFAALFAPSRLRAVQQNPRQLH